jgi:hypothetical protein
MAFARSIAAAYQRYGESPAQALKLAQITPNQLKQPTAHITARQMEILSGAAMQELDDEGLGAFSRKLPWGSYGMLARASISSPNLGVALKRWCRHHALIADDITLRLATSGDTAAITVEEKCPAKSENLVWSTCCAISTAWPAGMWIRAFRCKAHASRLRRRPMSMPTR